MEQVPAAGPRGSLFCTNRAAGNDAKQARSCNRRTFLSFNCQGKIGADGAGMRPG